MKKNLGSKDLMSSFSLGKAGTHTWAGSAVRGVGAFTIPTTSTWVGRHDSSLRPSAPALRLAPYRTFRSDPLTSISLSLTLQERVKQQAGVWNGGWKNGQAN